MTDLTWPSVVVFVSVLTALVAMFGLTDDAAMRTQILGYFGSIVSFIVGSAAGATFGYRRGYVRGMAAISAVPAGRADSPGPTGTL